MTTTETDLIGDALVHLPDIAAIRRRIHRHPEQGLHLPETQETIVEELRRLGLEPRIGTNLSSVTAVIPGVERVGDRGIRYTSNDPIEAYRGFLAAMRLGSSIS